MNDVGKDFVTIITMIIGVAIVAVLVSNKAKTSEVIVSFANGLSQLLNVVISPVTRSGSGSFGN